jgi:hypothetical protein
MPLVTTAPPLRMADRAGEAGEERASHSMIRYPKRRAP